MMNTDLSTIMMFTAWIITLLMWCFRENQIAKQLEKRNADNLELLMLQKASSLSEFAYMTDTGSNKKQSKPLSNNHLRDNIEKAYNSTSEGDSDES